MKTETRTGSQASEAKSGVKNQEQELGVRNPNSNQEPEVEPKAKAGAKIEAKRVGGGGVYAKLPEEREHSFQDMTGNSPKFRVCRQHVWLGRGCEVRRRKREGGGAGKVPGFGPQLF